MDSRLIIFYRRNFAIDGVRVEGFSCEGGDRAFHIICPGTRVTPGYTNDTGSLELSRMIILRDNYLQCTVKTSKNPEQGVLVGRINKTWRLTTDLGRRLMPRPKPIGCSRRYGTLS